VGEGGDGTLRAHGGSGGEHGLLQVVQGCGRKVSVECVGVNGYVQSAFCCAARSAWDVGLDMVRLSGWWEGRCGCVW
jgi:hypothetical protein